VHSSASALPVRRLVRNTSNKMWGSCPADQSIQTWGSWLQQHWRPNTVQPTIPIYESEQHARTTSSKPPSLVMNNPGSLYAFRGFPGSSIGSSPTKLAMAQSSFFAALVAGGASGPESGSPQQSAGNSYRPKPPSLQQVSSPEVDGDDAGRRQLPGHQSGAMAATFSEHVHRSLLIHRGLRVRMALATGLASDEEVRLALFCVTSMLL
jgi:hypothetical protein